MPLPVVRKVQYNPRIKTTHGQGQSGLNSDVVIIKKQDNTAGTFGLILTWPYIWGGLMGEFKNFWTCEGKRQTKSIHVTS